MAHPLEKHVEKEKEKKKRKNRGEIYAKRTPGTNTGADA